MATKTQQIAQKSGYSMPPKFQCHLPLLTRQQAQLATNRIDEAALEKMEWMDNPFPNLNWRWWI